MTENFLQVIRADPQQSHDYVVALPAHQLEPQPHPQPQPKSQPNVNPNPNVNHRPTVNHSRNHNKKLDAPKKQWQQVATIALAGARDTTS
jgi:hypothetical protein